MLTITIIAMWIQLKCVRTWSLGGPPEVLLGAPDVPGRAGEAGARLLPRQVPLLHLLRVGSALRLHLLLCLLLGLLICRRRTIVKGI